MVDKGLYQLLTQDSGVSALVGTNVFWILAPKASSFPLVVLDWVATSDTIAFQGDLGFRNGLLQVSCYASQHYPSRQIAQAVRNLLKSYKGNLPDADATAVAGVLQTKDWTQVYEEGSVGFVYRAMLEFRIWFYDSSLPITPLPNGPALVDGGNF